MITSITPIRVPETYSAPLPEQPKAHAPEDPLASSRPLLRSQDSNMRHLLQSRMEVSELDEDQAAPTSVPGPEVTKAVAESDSESPVTEINVASLWKNWHSSQRDQNIYRPAVEKYKADILNGIPIAPICISDIFVDESDQAVIRTADGRHRLTATYESNLTTIRVVENEMAIMAKEIFQG